MTLMEREEEKVRTVHQGSCRKLSREVAMQMARKMKAEALGIKRVSHVYLLYRHS